MNKSLLRIGIAILIISMLLFTITVIASEHPWDEDESTSIKDAIKAKSDEDPWDENKAPKPLDVCFRIGPINQDKMEHPWDDDE